MKTYYQQRAPVYDRVYDYPERQIDLEILHEQIPDYFAGRSVVEIAAGTGYWTSDISQHADSILAIDANSKPLEQIQNRDLRCSVTTAIHDAYDLPSLGKNFNCAFAGHWFSHIPIDQREAWLASLHEILEPGSPVVLLDNSATQTK